VSQTLLGDLVPDTVSGPKATISPASSRAGTIVVIHVEALLDGMVGKSTATDLIGSIDTDERSIDTAFDLLAAKRRRHVLAALAASDDPVSLSELAADVAGRESNGKPDGIAPAVVQDVAVSLHHVHLPKLAAGATLEYDASRDRVELSQPAMLADRVAGE
jgi:hypothetical protein